MKKRYLVLPLAISSACLFIGAVPVFAASSFTVEDAKTVAAPYLPDGSTFLRSETDSREYELKYYNESLQELYDLDISRITQTVTKLEAQKLDHRGSAQVTLSSTEVENLVKKQYPDASDLSIWLDQDDGYYVYEVSLTVDGSRVSLDIHPKTGDILEKEIDYHYISPDTAAQTSASLIGDEKARTLALKQVPDAVITDLDLEKESGILVYEIELYKDGYEYDLILNAQTGEKIYLSSHKDVWDDNRSISWDHHEAADSGSKSRQDSRQRSTVSPAISLEQAKQLLLDKVPGAQIKELELDTDDGRLIYEGELRKGRMEYEFEMDANTGSFLEWEQEYDD